MRVAVEVDVVTGANSTRHRRAIFARREAGTDIFRQGLGRTIGIVSPQSQRDRIQIIGLIVIVGPGEDLIPAKQKEDDQEASDGKYMLHRSNRSKSCATASQEYRR